MHENIKVYKNVSTTQAVSIYMHACMYISVFIHTFAMILETLS